MLNCIDRSCGHSKNIVEELLAVSIGLSSEDSDEDEDDDVVGDVLGVFNDGVTDQKNGSDVLETVGGQKESDTSGFDGITEDGLNLLVNVASFEDGLGFFDEGQKVSLGLEVFRVLKI